MTLVVARKIADSYIQVVSDTRISDKTATNRSSYLKGALKSVVLSPTRCLCYAGGVAVALEAIKGIYEENLASGQTEALIDYLLHAHRHSDQVTDFLLCDLDSLGVIHSVKGGEHWMSSSGWVGDSQAFSHFQESINVGPEHGAGDSLGHRMLSSMIRLVHSGAFTGIDSVGGHVIATSTSSKGFFYQHYSISSLAALRPGEDAARNDVAHGGYAESILVPKAAGVGAIAVHIFPVDIGVLYYPKLGIEGELTKGVSTAQYSYQLKEMTGIEFTGFDNSYVTISKV